MITVLTEALLRVPRAERLARGLISGRDVVIPRGVGRGLRFNAGASNIEYALGRNEISVQEALASLLKPGDIFYDVGANVGFFTVIAAHLLGPEGRVVAFEPVPENARIIARNVELNGFRNVELHEAAAAERSGEAELMLTAYSGGAALEGAPPPPDLTGTLKVETIAIDDLVARGCPPPQVVKVDVEGAEIPVFDGMTVTVESHRPAIVYEVDAANPEAHAAHAARCHDWLRTRGYQIRKLDDCYANVDWIVANYVATHPH